MYHSKSFLPLAILASSAMGIPAPLVHQLTKRAQPQIDGSIPADRQTQLLGTADVPNSGAFTEALELMAYAVTDGRDDIFAKYFNPGDRGTVDAIFNRLLGDDGVSGAPALSNIVVTAGDPDEADPAPAELINYDDPNPSILMSEDVWVYPGRDNAGAPDACATWDNEGLTLDMYLLASVVLHEYTHWDWFLGSIHNGEIIDQANGYGPENTRNLDKNLALYNADSYGWWATENFWAVICSKDGGYDIIDD